MTATTQAPVTFDDFARARYSRRQSATRYCSLCPRWRRSPQEHHGRCRRRFHVDGFGELHLTSREHFRPSPIGSETRLVQDHVRADRNLEEHLLLTPFTGSSFRLQFHRGRSDESIKPAGGRGAIGPSTRRARRSSARITRAAWSWKEPARPRPDPGVSGAMPETCPDVRGRRATRTPREETNI